MMLLTPILILASEIMRTTIKHFVMMPDALDRCSLVQNPMIKCHLLKKRQARLEKVYNLVCYLSHCAVATEPRK